jgi:alkaline phosphatase D
MLCFLLWQVPLIAQEASALNVVAGPLYGHFTDTTQNFWIAIKIDPFAGPEQNWLPSFNQAIYHYFEQETDFTVARVDRATIARTNYVLVNGVLNRKKRTRITKDISFLIGSCAMKVPAPPLFFTRKRERIFTTMTKHDKDFMIWLGDNVYYWFGQWNQKKKMHKVNLQARLNPKIDDFMKSCPQYAIWDDHDFGPNNSGASYEGKKRSLEIFKTYWANPYYGLDTAAGVFSHFSHSDADFFLMDGRYYAEDDKTLWGTAQTQWLKEKLKASTANFKFILSGTQIISDGAGEDMGDYDTTRQHFYDFLESEKITGVIVISGDRHYGELMRLERPNSYPIYEITTSPLTSFINPAYTRISAVRQGEVTTEPNFGKVHLFGKGENRKCRLELYDAVGKKLWERDIPLAELQY